ncbi:MAG: hypothetical protein CM15mP74_09280 [Halieaceae bacterium]|nr:MAG: hypothetical protein CM15mP74_09280 [Halieaceae bacterium]
MPTLRLNLCVESGAQQDHVSGNALEPVDFDFAGPRHRSLRLRARGLIDAAIERLLSAGLAPAASL